MRVKPQKGEVVVQEADLVVPHPELDNRRFEQELLIAAGYTRG
jgi:hypothetical protein